MAGQSGGGGSRANYKKARLAESLVAVAKQGNALKAERARKESANPDKYQPKQPTHVGMRQFDPTAEDRKNHALDMSMDREFKKRGWPKSTDTSMNYSYIDPKTKVQQGPS